MGFLRKCVLSMSFKVQRGEAAVNLVYIGANGVVDPQWQRFLQ